MVLNVVNVNIENKWDVQGAYIWSDKCVIKDSCESKGHQHCGMCETFPCDQLKAFAYDEKQGDDGKRIQQCQVWKDEKA